MWLYIDYCRQDYLWYYLPKPEMELILLKNKQQNPFIKNLMGTENCCIYTNSSNAYTMN